MAVRIRLMRVGRRHRPSYRLCAVDQRRARDSKVIEELGYYDPIVPRKVEQIKIKRERIDYWLGVGAQPSRTVRRLIERFDDMVAGSSQT